MMDILLFGSIVLGYMISYAIGFGYLEMRVTNKVSATIHATFYIICVFKLVNAIMEVRG